MVHLEKFLSIWQFSRSQGCQTFKDIIDKWNDVKKKMKIQHAALTWQASQTGTFFDSLWKRTWYGAANVHQK